MNAVCRDCGCEDDKERMIWSRGEWVHIFESACRKSLLKRVAELEARLAEYEWRPVTGDMAAGHYLVFNENEPQLSEVMELVYNDILRQWYIPNGYDDIMPAPTHWRPLPPPPQDS